jgi:UDP-N-acetylglucosamine 2-epimerase (non-hydrolysing)
MEVAAARPNFKEVAPLLRELRAREQFEGFLVPTGQHYDGTMSDPLFEDLGAARPDASLGTSR